jgi:hypothetical protein
MRLQHGIVSGSVFMTRGSCSDSSELSSMTNIDKAACRPRRGPGRRRDHGSSSHASGGQVRLTYSAGLLFLQHVCNIKDN